jgi:hypothetical protein
MPEKTAYMHYTDVKQTPETDRIPATCAKTLSRAVTFSSVISKSAPFVAATLPERTTWPISVATPTLVTAFLSVDKMVRLDSLD